MVAVKSVPAGTGVIYIETADGFVLTADLIDPEGPPRAAVLLAPAMGVARTFYRSFGAFLAESGFVVLSLDYRGIAGSRPKSLRRLDAKLHDWAELDLEAALAWLKTNYPGVPLLWVGHSVGGQLFGLLRDPPVKAAVFVGSQSGYYKNWDGAARYSMEAFWRVMIPTFTAVTGIFPMKAFGQGEDLPAGVAREWAEWGRNPDYILSYAKLRPGRAFEAWTGKLRSYAISDDTYAPPRSVEILLGYYSAAQTELRRVSPQDLGFSEIKHFGAFRKQFRDTLWAEIRDYLVAQSQPESLP